MSSKRPFNISFHSGQSTLSEPNTFRELVKTNTLIPVQIDENFKNILYTYPNIQAEEASISQFPLEVAYENYENTRKKIRSLLQVIVRQIFRQAPDLLQAGQNPILDIGSGMTGEMVRHLLPDSLKPNCLQIDINEKALQALQEDDPSLRVAKGSYHSIGIKNHFGLVTGLSSLDNTGFINNALEQIRSSLISGGYLVHVQDVTPGIIYPIQALLEMGETFPITGYINRSIASTFNQFTNKDDILAFETNEGPLTSTELFRRRFETAIENTDGFELLLNSWFTAIKYKNPNDPPHMNGFIYDGGLEVNFPTDDNNPLDSSVSAVVTIARKK